MLRIGLAAAVLLASAQDPKDDVAKAAEKTRELTNYAFKGRIQVDGVPFLSEPVDVSGAYVKDRGFTASMGPFGSIFRLDKKVAVKDPESGTWVLVKVANKVGEGPLAGQIPIIARGLKPPHEELKKLENRFSELKKREATEKIGETVCTVFEGPLTEGGVRASLPAGVGLLLGKGKFEGTGRVWIADGRIVRIETDATIEIEEKDTTSELKIKRTTDFVDVGKADVVMPEEVRKLFEE